MPTHYETLGINADADENEIKKAYRSLSFKHHPDRCQDQNSGEIMQKLNEAYEVLRDPQKRQQYNAELRGVPPGFPQGFPQGFPPGFPPGFPVFQGFGGGGGGNNIFEMLFSQMAGGGGGDIEIIHNGNGATFVRRHIGKPATIVKNVTLTLEQAFSGTILPVEIERWTICKEDGVRTSEMETINVKIPPGIDTNEAIMLEGIGNSDGVTKGDVKICITIDKHAVFIRQGADLFFKKTLTLKEALCGAHFQFEHLNGKIMSLNISNAIIFPGGKKVFNGLGMGATGNLIIDFDVSFPESLTTTQKEQLSSIL